MHEISNDAWNKRGFRPRERACMCTRTRYAAPFSSTDPSTINSQTGPLHDEKEEKKRQESRPLLEVRCRS